MSGSSPAAVYVDSLLTGRAQLAGIPHLRIVLLWCVRWALSRTKTKKSNIVGKLFTTKNLKSNFRLADEYKRPGSITGRFSVQQQLQKQP
jgi:hypothetical protein